MALPFVLVWRVVEWPPVVAIEGKADQVADTAQLLKYHPRHRPDLSALSA
jgi:hypothetical protein